MIAGVSQYGAGVVPAELREALMALRQRTTAPVVVAFAMRKGGTGKTTSAVNTAHALAHAGARVLLVDFDAQGQSAQFLGVSDQITQDNDAQTFFSDRRAPELAPVQARDGLFVFGGGGSIIEAEAVIRAMRLDLVSLAERLLAEAGSQGFEVVVIDTPPAGLFQELAFVCSDLVVLCVEATYASVSMVADTVAAIAEVSRLHGTAMPDLRYLPTKRTRTNDATVAIDELTALVPDGDVWPAVPATVRVKESQAFGRTALEYIPAHGVGAAYVMAAQAILKIAEADHGAA